MSIESTPPPPGWGAPGTGGHRVRRLLGDLAQALDAIVDESHIGLTDTEVAELLDGLTRAQARITAAVTGTVAEADRRSLGDEIGARHTHQWWAHRSQLTRPHARRLVSLGTALSQHAYAPVRDAYARGEVDTDQTQVIVHALDTLPGDLDDTVRDQVRDQARDHLLALAAHHDAHALRRLGKRILDIVAPEIADEHEQRLLDAEERRAARTASFTMTDDGHGRVHGKFTLPAHQGLMLRRALLAIANPKRHDHDSLRTETGEWKSMPERLGAAFGDYIERFPTERLPAAGGTNATLVVTIDHHTLIDGLGTATLDNGEHITASLARRLACEAGIIPMVLGGRSEVLDLGRTRRLHTKAQRIALAHRDGGCTTHGCDIPAGGCHAHHDHPWSHGGPTNLDNARLLCPRHHRLIHHPHYETNVNADNTVTFHRRT